MGKDGGEEAVGGWGATSDAVEVGEWRRKGGGRTARGERERESAMEGLGGKGVEKKTKPTNEPPQDHRISHIRTLKLVKTQHPRFLRNISRNITNPIQPIPMLHLPRMQPPMHILHEMMKMHPLLRRDMWR